MHEHHPRVHFRGPRHYELGIILSGRLRKAVESGLRYRRRLKVAAKKRKAAPIKISPQPNAENLVTVIRKAQSTSSALLAKKFFKKLAFSSTVEQEAAKAIFLSRLQAAQLQLSSLKRGTTTSRRTRRLAGVERVALRAARSTNSERRKQGLLHLQSVQGMLKQERQLSA